METLFEILKNILPAIITGFFTFVITRYTYNNNRPLDKLEISYNRVYYPLQRLINCNDISFFIDNSKLYFDKYNKYIDRSTLKAYDILCKCNMNNRKKAAYQNLKNNIYNRSLYLRRKLGYLEPNYLQIYAYLPKNEKSTLRIIIETVFAYSALGFIGIAEGGALVFLSCLLMLVLFVLFVEIICKMIRFLYYKIMK